MDPSPAAPASATAPGTQLRTLRVAIADDDRFIRMALTHVLRSDPAIEVVGMAETTDEAITLMARQQPDVCLIDVTMPGGGGPRASREIRACSPRTRIVAHTSHQDRATVLEMLSAGASGYLVKGAAPAEILESIRRAAHGEAILSREVTAGVVEELSDRLAHQEEERRRLREAQRRVRDLIDGDRLTMVFQPIVELATGELFAYEGLSRFSAYPPRTPDVWFAEAAACGLALDLELKSFSRGLEGFAAVPAANLSLNVSPESALSAGFAELLADAPADRLVIEITEHAPVNDYDALSAALRPLRDRGMRLAVDDAGAGSRACVTSFGSSRTS